MFTVEQRDARREHLLRLAEEDERVVTGAAVGSLAVAALHARGCIERRRLWQGERYVGAVRVEPAALRAALAASVLALMREGTEVDLLSANVFVERLALAQPAAAPPQSA
jgi:hypothetical protein